MRRIIFIGLSSLLSVTLQAQDSTKIAIPAKAVPAVMPLAPQIRFKQFNSSKQTTQEKASEDFQFLKNLEMHTAEIVISPEESKLIHTPEEDQAISTRGVNGPSQYDSRVELRSLDPKQPWVQKIIKNAYSVAVIVDRSRLRQLGKSFYEIDGSNTLGKMYQLCPGEAFVNQPVVGSGTAIVTGKRQMLTAAHVFAASPKQYAVIFGYEIINSTGAYQKIFPADSIYFPQKIERQSPELDIAVFTVDRDIKAGPLKWSAAVHPPKGQAVYMIGFPYGLPVKVAANASIQANDDLYTFYTSLDAFQGNSGSPVFNLQTNEVLGILVSGGVDYQWTGSCNKSTACSIPFCQGEKAVRITAIKNMLGL